MLEDVPQEFWNGLANAPRRALLLDYDGTLAPFRPKRDEAYPYPGVTDALKIILAQGETRVVLVTGRDARDLPNLMPLDPRPEIWGSHGLERVFPDGSLKPLALPPATNAALRTVRETLEESVPVEQLDLKPGCVAVHWRGLTDDKVERIQRAGMEVFTQHAGKDWLGLREFDGGLELRCVISTKADTVRTVVSEEPQGLRLAYLGDDLTDEDAFAALPEHGLGVLVRPELRETRASVWLKPPEQLLGFLTNWRAACAGADDAKPINRSR